MSTRFQGRVKIVHGATSVDGLGGVAVLGVALAEGAGTSRDVSKGRVPWQTGETAYLPATLRPCAPKYRGALRSFICLDPCESWAKRERLFLTYQQ